MKQKQILRKIELNISNGFSKDYFRGQKDRYARSLGLVKRYCPKQSKILEVGSMPFHFTLLLKELGYNIICIDKNPSRESKFIKTNNLEIKRCNIETDKLPLNDKSFDRVLFMETFEHLYQNPIFALKEINRVMKKDGLLILTTPNAYSLKRVTHFFLGKGLGENPYNEFDKLNWAGHLGHIREYSKPELKFFLKKMGFRIEKVIFEYYGHKRFEKNRLIRSCLKVFYSLSPKFRPHIIVIARK